MIHEHHSAHTHKEWLAFLKKVWHSAPRGFTIEIIADNYAAHKRADVEAWLRKHPRIHMHYAPTSSSWMNLVERFFCEITRDCIREGSFASVADLEREKRSLRCPPQRGAAAYRLVRGRRGDTPQDQQGEAHARDAAARRGQAGRRDRPREAAGEAVSRAGASEKLIGKVILISGH